MLLICGVESSVSVLPCRDWWVLVRAINTLHHDLIVRMDKEGQRLTYSLLLHLILWEQHPVRLGVVRGVYFNAV